jgi:prevent-host-death family protein
MTSWPVQDAKARFSEFLDACLEHGPQVVTRRGAEAAVLVPLAQWRALTLRAQPTLKDWLLQPDGRTEVLLPRRRPVRRRKVAPAD